MKTKKLALAICLIMGSCSVAQLNYLMTDKPDKEVGFDAKVIYGEDDRVEYYEVGPELRRVADSTAILVRNYNLSSAGNQVLFSMENYKEAMGLCDSEPFGEQDLLGFCSGSLVAPDIVLTAGHCMNSDYDCNNSSVVFGFNKKSPEDRQSSTSISNVYHCAEIIHSEDDGASGSDFSLFRLDRPVVGREPLRIKTSTKARVGDAMVVMGHPVGLPLKIAGGANVREDKGAYFIANLDTYGGNSGSAVFDAFSGEIAGILVRGEVDFVRRGGCSVSKVCADNACSGEDVTHAINAVPYLPSYE